MLAEDPAAVEEVEQFAADDPAEAPATLPLAPPPADTVVPVVAALIPVVLTAAAWGDPLNAALIPH